MINSITENLIGLSKYVLVQNSFGLTDINKNSENFFCGLLNIIYSLQLRNMNSIQNNYPAIDLGDGNSRVCFQITSEHTKGKIEDTIKLFKQKNLNLQYDSLIFLLISDKSIPNINIQENFMVKFFDTKAILTEINNIQNLTHVEAIANYISQNLQSSSNKSSSILPSNIRNTVNVGDCNALFKSSKYSFDEGEKELIRSDLKALQSILISISQNEREYIYYIVKNGGLPEKGSSYFSETILIPVAKLDLAFGQQVAYQIYQSLTTVNFVDYEAEYQPSDDRPYIPVIILHYRGEWDENLFVWIKKFTKNSDQHLCQMLVDADFSCLN